MTGKILEFKLPVKEAPQELPHETILNNLTDLVCALDEGTIFLSDLDGTESDFLPVLGLTLLVDQEGNIIIQTNTQDHWIIREALDMVLDALDNQRDEEE